MFNLTRCGISRMLGILTVVVLGALAPPVDSQISEEAVIHGIDSSVTLRDQNIVSYTVTEHYSVYRNQDKARDKVNPAAEMTVKSTYQKDHAKRFNILNQSGSELLLKQVLGRVLDSERTVTQPANRAAALITSANYTMHVKGRGVVDGRTCIVLSIAPRQSAPYLLQGDLWVDAQDYSIVQLSGVTSKSPSVLVGPSQVARHYATIDGFPMATHATAISNSWVLGQTTIEIDYSGYQIEPRTAN